jgi:beta-glucosidase
LRQLPLISENVVDNEGGSGFTLRKYNIGETKPYQTLNGQSDSQFFIHTNFDVVNTNVELVLINDKLIYEQKGSSPDPMGFLLGGVSEELVEFAMEADQKYKILITSSPPTAQEGEDLGILEGKTGVRLGCMSKKEHDTDLLGEAVALAKEADYALVFTGHTTAWETEGQDQTGYNLPKDGSQDRLVAGVAAANPNTMPWLDNIAGLLQTWFPGQEAGNSIADILTGKVNPEGALTCSFPKELSSAPAHGNFPGEYKGRQLTVNYAEGVFVGYRHFDTLPADKLNFPFGFGLSYTTFEFADFSVDAKSQSEWTAAVNVKNTGKVAGAALVQVYVGSSKRVPENPIKVLVAFGKTTLEAGESRVVKLDVKARDFASWSEAEHKWVVEAGDFDFSIARSAADLIATKKVTVEGQSEEP